MKISVPEILYLLLCIIWLIRCVKAMSWDLVLDDIEHENRLELLSIIIAIVVNMLLYREHKSIFNMLVYIEFGVYLGLEIYKKEKIFIDKKSKI